jgi:hypothetical protein
VIESITKQDTKTNIAQSDIERTAERASEQLELLKTQAIEIVREHPGKVLLGAVALGYLVGRVARAWGKSE